MPAKSAHPTRQHLETENQELRNRLEEAEETLRAIRSGEVDALVVLTQEGEQIFTLRGADRTYRVLIERMNEGALTTALDGTILYANRRFADMLQTSLERVIGSHIAAWIAAPSQLDFQRLVEVAASGTGRAELMLAAADRTTVPANFSVSAMPSEELPQTLGIVVTDLTERKQAEDAVRESRQRFATMFHAAPVAVAMFTFPGGVLVDVNATFEAAFEYSREEALGRTFSDLGIDPGRENLDRLTTELKVRRSLHDVETELYTRTGARRTFRLDMDVVQIGGERFCLQTAQDITARKQAQEEIRLLNRSLERRIVERTAQLNSVNAMLVQEAEERERAQNALGAANQRISDVLESIREGFFAVDKNWRLVYVNQRAAQPLGSPREELLGRNLWDVLPGLVGTERETQYRQAMQERQPTSFEGVAVPDGRNCEFHIYPLADGISVFYIDITERTEAQAEIKRLNEDLVQRARALEIANKDLEAFTYSVSHDLRAPLRHIDGLSKMIADKYGAQVPEQGQAYLGMLRENVQHMGRLLDALLMLSRTSRQPLAVQEVLPAVLVRRVIEELQPEDATREIQFIIGDHQASPEQALPLCMADPDLLQQVYVNLISNAVKFTRRCPVATIEIGAMVKDGQQIYYVKDNGVGFDMQYADKLFGVFQRLHSDNEFEGTGAGLAIVQRIVRRHGGDIWAEAEVDKGAAFYFTLPEM